MHTQLQYAYVGYNDALKSVIYYNVETCKIFTSCNYIFLTIKPLEPSKEIQLKDTLVHAREREKEHAPRVEHEERNQKNCKCKSSAGDNKPQ